MTDWQLNKQTGEEVNWKAFIDSDRKTVRQIDEHIEKWTDSHTDRWTRRKMDRQSTRQMATRQMDSCWNRADWIESKGQKGRCKEEYIDRYIGTQANGQIDR